MSRISPCSPLVIIDGYNLLYAEGIYGVDNPTGTLEDARDALIDWILDTLPSDTVKRTILTFDAKNPPPNLPRQFNHSGLTVHFAAEFEEADDLIGEYIEAHTSPSQLTVVSSDHRVQRMAHRRDATAVDSNVWFRQMTRSAFDRSRSDRIDTSKPNVPLNSYDVGKWIKVFGLEGDAELLFSDEELGDLPPIKRKQSQPKNTPEIAQQKQPDRVNKKPSPDITCDNKINDTNDDDWDKIFADLMQESDEIVREFGEPDGGKSGKKDDPSDLNNPFPPGYGEDLLD